MFGNLVKELLGGEGQAEGGYDMLGNLGSSPAHTLDFHLPCVLLAIGCSKCLGGYCVQPLCVWVCMGSVKVCD